MDFLAHGWRTIVDFLLHLWQMFLALHPWAYVASAFVAVVALISGKQLARLSRLSGANSNEASGRG